MVPSALAQLVNYGSFHAAVWTQTSASPSFDRSNASHFYAARIEVTDPGDATAATLTAGATMVNLSPTSTPGELLGYSALYAPGNDGLFDTDFPPAITYSFSITGGTLMGQAGGISHPDPLPWPDTFPVFDNYDSLSAVDANNPTFSWNSWVGAPSYPSAIFFQVWDGATPVWSTILSTGTTSYTLPPGVLSASSVYTAELIFSSRLLGTVGSWSSDPFAPGLASYDFRTQVEFTAVPEPGAFATLAGLGLISFALLHRRKAKCPVGS
ncbi:MAG: hypothetical protein IPM17_10240 [Verrucomicrobia bacterium]|nr:hypothetical protein [Verrucomicrobiota bacterium]